MGKDETNMNSIINRSWSFQVLVAVFLVMFTAKIFGCNNMEWYKVFTPFYIMFGASILDWINKIYNR